MKPKTKPDGPPAADATLTNPPPPAERPAPENRMVRVRNVSTRAISEGGREHKPGDEFDITPERAAAYQQRVRAVKR